MSSQSVRSAASATPLLGHPAPRPARPPRGRVRSRRGRGRGRGGPAPTPAWPRPTHPRRCDRPDRPAAIPRGGIAIGRRSVGGRSAGPSPARRGHAERENLSDPIGLGPGCGARRSDGSGYGGLASRYNIWDKIQNLGTRAWIFTKKCCARAWILWLPSALIQDRPVGVETDRAEYGGV